MKPPDLREALRTAPEQMPSMEQIVAAAVAKEREACARIAETCTLEVQSSISCEQQAESDRRMIAAAIRARGEATS